MLLLIIVLLLALTAAVIWALHRNQLRKQVEVVDRIKDLPPLESTALPDFSMPPVDATASGSGTTQTASAPTVRGGPGPPSPASTLSQMPENPQPIWQDQVKGLKDKGDLESAIQLCQQHFPKAHAFQQAAVLLRLQIKQQVERQQPAQALAARLYRCAALADLFRAGAPLKPVNPREAMKKLSSTEFQYREIGHQHLKLLTKSDIKLLEQLWGKPEVHRHAEAPLAAHWEQICRP